jgi:OmpA-OmpF porin, OOP family
MHFRRAALAAMGLAISLGGGAAAQPVSGLYVGAGVGANWLLGAEGNVLGENPGTLLARLAGAPDLATLQRNAAAAQQAAAAVQAAAGQAAAQAAVLQAAANNPALPPAARAVAAQQLPAAQAAAQQAATQATVAQGLAQNAQAVSNTAAAAQNLGRDAKISFDVGWVGVASLGWGFGNGLRAEVEGNYRTNDVDEVRFLGLPTASGGRARSYGVMGNLFYDFDPGFFGIGPGFVQPYVGAGVGYVWTEYEKLRASAAGFTVTANDTDGRFAFQGIAGVAVPLTWLGVRGLTLTAEYRFLGTLEPRVGAELRAGGPNGPVLLRREVDTGNYNHSALLGVRYAFNQPGPPPPPPAPAAVPAPPPAAQPGVGRAFLVLFDWDRADLTDRARRVVAEAAQEARRAQATRLEVAGHADRSGTPAHNERLSRRRAEAVAAELVRSGVDRGDIVVTAFGESRPLVPTADGVREPQNRRVEIVLR